MKFSTYFRRIIVSWDFGASVILTILLMIVLPQDLPVQIAKEIFEVSISVLAVIFSVFFAAMAILITAGDNDFVRFLEEDGSYRQIIWAFRVTLLMLFIALLISIILYISVLQYIGIEPPYYFPEWLLLIYSFLSVYALFAAFNSAMDAIKYAEFRARFLKITRDNWDSK